MDREYYDEGRHKPSRLVLDPRNTLDRAEPQVRRPHYESTASNNQRFRSVPRSYYEDSISSRQRHEDSRNQYGQDLGIVHRPRAQERYAYMERSRDLSPYSGAESANRRRGTEGYSKIERIERANPQQHDRRQRRDLVQSSKPAWEYDVPPEATTISYEKFEQPMDPKEFKEECRRSYLEAAAARQRNADLSVWGKCAWATYDGLDGYPRRR